MDIIVVTDEIRYCFIGDVSIFLYIRALQFVGESKAI